MSPDTNITMAEALRLTRAGRLTEATAVLQRGLASAGTPAAGESTAAQPWAISAVLDQPCQAVVHSAGQACPTPTPRPRATVS